MTSTHYQFPDNSTVFADGLVMASPLRAAITAAYRTDEPTAVAALLKQARGVDCLLARSQLTLICASPLGTAS